MTPGSKHKYVDVGLFILRLGLGAMFVASCVYLSQGTGLQPAPHAIEAGIVFLAAAITGPGKYTFRL